MNKKINKILNIYLFIFIVILFSLSGCKDRLQGLQYEKIKANHEIFVNDVSSYFIINSKPVLEKNDINQKFSITIFSNIITGTKRYFNYYQIDYQTDENIINQYYHIFESDAKKRNYAQNFFPYNYIEGNYLSKIDVLFNYEYMIGEQKTVADLKYSEEMFTLNVDEIATKDFVDRLDNFDINLICIHKNTEDFNRFKLNIYFNELEENSHIDFQSWIVTKDKKIYPFYGIYHYQINNGDFISIGDQTIERIIDFDSIYCKVKYYNNNESEPSEYLYKTNIIIKEE